MTTEMNDNQLEQLWDEFSNIAIDEDECITQEFHIFEAGTDRSEIWQWFDQKHSKGTAYLLGSQ